MYLVFAFYEGFSHAHPGSPVLITADKMWAIYVANHLESEEGYAVNGMDAGVAVYELEPDVIIKQRHFTKKKATPPRRLLVSFPKYESRNGVWVSEALQEEYKDYVEDHKEKGTKPQPKVVALRANG